MRGIIQKMPAKIVEGKIHYMGLLRGEYFDLNTIVGNEMGVKFTGRIFCPNCTKQVKKLYQGFCYPCFSESAAASPCILRPELCEAHLGKGRDLEWEQKVHNQPHAVYFALSSAVKVGVTRMQQVPTRWIDQGASRAQVIAEVPYRQLAGEIEVLLKSHYTDKTNWRKMLSGEDYQYDLEDLIEALFEQLPEEYHDFIQEPEEWVELHFPILEYPEKIKSIHLEKTPDFRGELLGIKGQYLMLREGGCWNVRSWEGYEVEIDL